MSNDDSNSVYNFIEMDDAKKGQLPLPQTAARPPSAPAAPVPGVTVSQDGAARASQDEDDLRKMGFAPKPPIFAIGTLVNEMGQKNFRLSRQKWEALPSAETALTKLIERVQGEDRSDMHVAIPTLTMQDDGKLVVRTVKDDQVFEVTRPLTDRGLEGLCSFATPGGARYLAACAPALRALNLNSWFPRGVVLDARGDKKRARKCEENGLPPPSTPLMKDRIVTLRSRHNPKIGREIFAVCGPSYTPHDVDKVAAQVLSYAPKDAKCEVVYDGYRAKMDLLWHSNVQPQHAVAGEFFKTGIRIKAADDGSGSISVQMLAWRNLCLNLIVIDFAKVLVGSRKHIGKVENIAGDVEKFIEIANERMALFVSRWDDASAENVLERYNLSNPREVFEGLVLNKVVAKPVGVDNEEMVSRLMSAWSVEQGYTKSAFLNAITRCAHTEEWQRWSDADDLESVAGELLFQKVWQCVPPKTQTVEELLS